ncbi:hypothetical protein FALBO_7411 [Fusarium albosuccineum]|uniref:Uncharacterized protein n=1 Tax=Fusarium albosuccineum TaxID=1237068 RepID=A0A8H4PDR6_9HYPO|nr:hypothetical protein FALBO_7411 [Fusarium albosuccineum]
MNAYPINQLQSYFDSLVASGAISLLPGMRIKVGDDGVPRILSIALGIHMPTTTSWRATDAWQRLCRVIKYLESSTAPLYNRWRGAIGALHQLRDRDVVQDPDLVVRSIVQKAHSLTEDDLEELNPNKGFIRDMIFNNSCEFLQRSCEILFHRPPVTSNENDVGKHASFPSPMTVCDVTPVVGYDPGYDLGMEA